MAKKAEQNKVCDKTGLTLEQNTLYDDNLLPPADELAKLDSVSKDIIPWIMKRTEMEQDARIKFNEDRMKIAQNDFKHIHCYKLYSSNWLLLLYAPLGFHYDYKMYQETGGTNVAGGTIVLIVFLFLKAKN